jgi:hypothetical protein
MARPTQFTAPSRASSRPARRVLATAMPARTVRFGSSGAIGGRKAASSLPSGCFAMAPVAPEIGDHRRRDRGRRRSVWRPAQNEEKGLHQCDIAAFPWPLCISGAKVSIPSCGGCQPARGRTQEDQFLDPADFCGCLRPGRLAAAALSKKSSRERGSTGGVASTS